MLPPSHWYLPDIMKNQSSCYLYDCDAICFTDINPTRQTEYDSAKYKIEYIPNNMYVGPGRYTCTHTHTYLCMYDSIYTTGMGYVALSAAVEGSRGERQKLPAPVADIKAFSVGVTKWDIRNRQSPFTFESDRSLLFRSL